MSGTHLVVDKSDKIIPYYPYIGGLWANLVINHIEKGILFEQGDAMVIRNELQAAGFEWGKDFYLKKI